MGMELGIYCRTICGGKIERKVIPNGTNGFMLYKKVRLVCICKYDKRDRFI